MTDADDRNLTWVVGKDGERLDQHVAAKVADLSRSRAQRLIQAGSVLLNGQPAKPSQLLRTGDAIAFTMPPHSDGGVLPEPMALVIVYESADVVVVDKPAGVVVHPAAGQSGGTLVNGMLDRYPEMAEVGPPGRQGVAHRLDRGTSGLVLFGRTPRGLRVLQEQFRAHEIWKTYLALVVGLLRPDKATIDAPIGRHPRERSRMAVVRGGGRPARTQYETIAECRGYSLVRAHPLTGRTHQIRVHFAAVAHPVAGDPVYGHGPADLGLQRQFLHAQALRFRDPGVEDPVSLESPLPDDLSTVLAALKCTETRR